jgi:hypothetical protein
LERGADGFEIIDVAPGFTPDEVIGLAEMEIKTRESLAR